MPYSTTQAVRSEAWFEKNPNVLEPTIAAYLSQATWIVQSYVSAVYKLNNLKPGALNFAGSQAEGVLKRAEELFAAGYLLMKEYWLQALATDKDGQRKIQEAEKLLQRLIDWKHPLRLIDSEWNEFERIASNSSRGKLKWTGINAGWNVFSMEKQF